MIEVVSPADSGLPIGRVASGVLARSAGLPVAGVPVLVLHGPIATRAALGFAPDKVLIRSLAPLVPTVHVPREEIVAITVEQKHWYAFGRRVVSVRRIKGPTVRLMAPSVPGVPDGTDNLCYLLRAWWRSSR
jgi:hypothetical protein